VIGELVESNFTSKGITPCCTETSCSFLSDEFVKRFITPEAFSVKLFAGGDLLALQVYKMDIKIGSKFALFSMSVTFLSLAGRLLSMPTAAAFSLSDVDDETILTMLKR
jgi:hypothetical protein